MKKMILKSGLFRKSNQNNETKSEVNLNSWLKRILNYFHISFVDPCCPIDIENLPVRYNDSEGTVQYWNGTEYVIIPVGGQAVCYDFFIENLTNGVLTYEYRDCHNTTVNAVLTANETFILCGKWIKPDPGHLAITNLGDC